MTVLSAWRRFCWRTCCFLLRAWLQPPMRLVVTSRSPSAHHACGRMLLDQMRGVLRFSSPPS
jgi:hypothetical protein